jgi:ankyrin repeat protein
MLTRDDIILPAVAAPLDAASPFSATDNNGNTIVHLAAQHGHPGIAAMLELAPCLATAQNSDGNTPLHLAVIHAPKNLNDLHQYANYVAVVNALIAASDASLLQERNHAGNRPHESSPGGVIGAYVEGRAVSTYHNQFPT